MPRTRTVATPQLEILLDGIQPTFHPGDAITGRIIRGAPVVSSRAWLTIQLIGRSKTKIVISRGQAGTSIYRGRYSFFHPSETQTRLFDGPIHVPEGASQEWAFTLSVPTAMDPSAVAAGNQQRASYLSLSRQDIPGHPLPPVFYTSGVSRVLAMKSYEGFVEYFLTAELHVEPASGQTAVHAAHLPINVVAPPTPELLVEAHNLKRRSFLCRLSTHRLAAEGGESASLSLQQRAQEMFRSSHVPQFAFSLQVEHPTVLPIGNPEPIPFRLLVLPDRDQTTAAIRDSPQTVVLTAMTFEIRACTHMVCPAAWSTRSAEQGRKFDFGVKAALEARAAGEEPVVVPSGEKAEALDVGALLDLSMANAPLVRRVFSNKRVPLSPTFTTYNVKHTHRLRWELKLTVAGESTEVSSEVDVTLVPGSAGGELPPYEEFEDGEGPDMDAPPPPLEDDEREMEKGDKGEKGNKLGMPTKDN